MLRPRYKVSILYESFDTFNTLYNASMSLETALHCDKYDKNQQLETAQ